MQKKHEAHGSPAWGAPVSFESFIGCPLFTLPSGCPRGQGHCVFLQCSLGLTGHIKPWSVCSPRRALCWEESPHPVLEAESAELAVAGTQGQCCPSPPSVLLCYDSAFPYLCAIGRNFEISCPDSSLFWGCFVLL